MTAEVRFLNFASGLWREHDTEPYAKCVFLNTKLTEFVFTDLNNQDEDTMCILFNRDQETRYLKNIEAAEKVHYWLETKQPVLVARLDEVTPILERIQAGDRSGFDDDEKNIFLPIEF